MPIRLVIFDVAGTIIEDRGEVVSAFQAALQKNGIAAGEDQLREWKGAAKREVIRRFVEQHSQASNSTDPEGQMDGRVERIYSDFRKHLESHYLRQGVVPIPGAQAAFDWLRERGICLATTTGFYRQVSDLILQKAGWEKIFDANICSDDVPRGRPAPYMIFRAMEVTGVTDVAQVINVGDTPLDLQAASNAGVRGVAVLTGVHTAERLRQERHTHIVASVAALPGLFEEMRDS